MLSLSAEVFLIPDPSSIYKRHLYTGSYRPRTGKSLCSHAVKMSVCKFYAQGRCSKGKDCAFVHSPTHSLESAEVGIHPITQTQLVRACNLKIKFPTVSSRTYTTERNFTLATRAYGTYPVCLCLQRYL